jgi:hypothetical protein
MDVLDIKRYALDIFSCGDLIIRVVVVTIIHMMWLNDLMLHLLLIYIVVNKINHMLVLHVTRVR